jgi:sugar transferase (PEP-CTERM/EpsH1 system associated)
MAEYIFKSKLLKTAGKGGVSKRPKLIMDFCDVDSDKWLQYSKESNFPLNLIYQKENIRLQAYEERVYKSYDSSILISEQEKTLFLKTCPEAKDLAVIPNGVDSNYFSPAIGSELPEQNEDPVLVFTGAMDYHANVDGVCWFCEKILPILQERLPEVQFSIVGRNPAPAIKKLDSLPGVHVIGNVEDIRPWYQKADVYVVPLRLARGVQNKVLEAMAMGRVVVTTSKANAGIAAADKKHLMLADTVEEFADAITILLHDKVKRANLERNARKFVLDEYEWTQNMIKLEALLI